MRTSSEVSPGLSKKPGALRGALFETGVALVAVDFYRS
jgi:hypothetical protein